MHVYIHICMYMYVHFLPHRAYDTPPTHTQVDGCCWYGGGCDLTPAYLFDQDAVDFHTFWKHVCDSYCTPHTSYQTFKAWCDRYFYIPARKEHRGVGGLFFDDLVEGEEEYDVRQVRVGVGGCSIPILPVHHLYRNIVPA